MTDGYEDGRLIAASLRGRTITDVDLQDGNSGPCYLTLTLDDGRTIEVAGWGHDWWGLDIREPQP